MYCIDSCVLIEASRRFYAFDFFPDFWWWLSQEGNKGIWTSPLQVYKEIVENTNRRDTLNSWVEQNKSCFSNPSKDVQKSFKEISNYIVKSYVDYQAERALKKADPWVVALALAKDLTVVSFEVPVNLSHSFKSGKFDAEVKIPNLCNEFGIRYINLFDMLRELKVQFTIKD